MAERRAVHEARTGIAAPIDAVTTSGSGLDPHISRENAIAQSAAIAAARGADPATVRRVIQVAVEPVPLGLYGEPSVNVLRTNLVLDAAVPIPPADGSGVTTE